MLLISKWKLIKWDSSEIDYLLVKLVRPDLDKLKLPMLLISSTRLVLKIYDTINDASKENKKAVIPDSLILLFLQIIDDIINTR